MKGYLIITSIGERVPIDADEISIALKIWKSGDIHQFKQGIVRGDLIGVIIEDKKRVMVEERFREGKNESKFIPLPNIFKDIKYLTEGNNKGRNNIKKISYGK